MNELFHYSDRMVNIHYKRDSQPSPLDFKMHTHESYELFYFAGGNGIYRVEGTPYPLEKGDVLIMRPAEAHYIDLNGSLPYTRLTINFRPELLKEIDPEGKLLLPFDKREAGTLNRYPAEAFPSNAAEIFISRILERSPDQRLHTLAYLPPLLYEIYHSFQNLDESKTEHPLDYRIVRYVNYHVSEDLSLAHLCDKFFISESQLCRTFKNAVGSTVWEYITVKRLVNARKLILSGIPPTKAYLRCGFKDYSAFYRAYRKKGIPPLACHPPIQTLSERRNNRL